MALPLELVIEIYRALFQHQYQQVFQEVREKVSKADSNNLVTFLQKGQQDWKRTKVSMEDMNITKQILWGSGIRRFDKESQPELL